MPTYNGISTQLESQYDIQRIQEYTLPSSHSGNHWRRLMRISAPPNTPNLADNYDARDHVSKSPVIDVHVPIYPNSQFWLIYHIDPDVLNHSPRPTIVSSSPTVEDMNVKYVYFKMSLPARSLSSFPLGNDEVKRTVSWGVGLKDMWKGKTMFGLFHGEHQGMARKIVDKRSFWFSEDPNNEGSFVIQIFRARGRRRTSRAFPEMKARKREGNEVELVNTGRVKGHHPQRYYQYALIDPVDEPYVIFRYHLRSMDRLRALGIDPPLLCNDMTPRFWRPTSDDTLQEQAGDLDNDQESHSTSPDAEVDSKDQNPENEYAEALTCDPDRPDTLELYPYRTEQPRPSQSIALRRNLSIPPTIRLLSTSSFHEPHSPAKSTIAKEPAKTPFDHSFLSSDSGSDSDSDSDPDLDLDEPQAEDSNPDASVNSNTSTAKDTSASNETREIGFRQSQIPKRITTSSTRILKTPSPTDVVVSQPKQEATPPSSRRIKAMGRLLMGMRDTALLRRKVEVEAEALESSEVGYEVIRESW